MSDIAPVCASSMGGPIGSDDSRRVPPAEPARLRGQDKVELSDVGVYLSRLKDLPVRQDVVDAARARLARGEYDTLDALDAALNELIKDI